MKIIDNKQKAIEELGRISKRTTSENDINSIVEEILNEVKKDGDAAIEKYTKKFDGYNPSPMEISNKNLRDAWEKTDYNLKRSLENAYKRIRRFHEKEIPSSGRTR